jgi:hypothetical protein
MTSFLIEKIQKNINLIINITDEITLIDICDYFFDSKDKESILFLI